MKTLIPVGCSRTAVRTRGLGRGEPGGGRAAGAELTPLGGEKANADGSIPAWNGGLKSAADRVSPATTPGDHYPDPYANDKPLFTITAANLGQYAAKVTEGHKALFKTYPDNRWWSIPRIAAPRPGARVRGHEA